MRFPTLCAIALSASSVFWTFPDSSQAQPGKSVSQHGNKRVTTVRPSRSSTVSGHSAVSGDHHHRHPHSGHAHHAGHGFGRSYYQGSGLYPFSSGYYSSYTSFYTPFGGSFFYGTATPGFGCYNSTWGYPSGLYSAPAYQYFPTPVVVPNYPPFTQPLIDAQAEAEARWAEELKLGSHIQIPIKEVVASSTQEKLRSQRLQMSGDELFRKQFFSQALHQYREANSVAQDLPGPYYRMAVIYAIQGKFDAAVTYLKRTLELDPTWPTKGDTLTMLYGDNNSLARNALLIEVSRWVEEDIRDPDRSFLMGAFLYEFDQEKAATFLETSARLSGTTRYVSPFLYPVGNEDDPHRGEPAEALPQPPLPEPNVPTPPVPQAEPEPGSQEDLSGLKTVPNPGSRTSLPAPRRGEIVTPVYKSPLKGPELPPLGN